MGKAEDSLSLMEKSRAEDCWWISQLPSEIMDLILIKLPAKDLIKLTYVSKHLKLIISQPYFLNLHLSTNPNQHHLLFFACYISNKTIQWYTGEPMLSRPTFSLCNHPDVHDFQLVGSARGLLCLCNSYHSKNYPMSSDLTLWNPLAAKSKKITPPDFHVFPADINILILGFAFDHVNLDFKIVMIYEPRDIIGYAAKFSVYSQKKKSWSDITRMVWPFRVAFKERNGVSLNGVAYWLANRAKTGEACIMGFDLVNEVFTKILNLPPDGDDGARILRLFTVDEEESSLFLFVSDRLIIPNLNCCEKWSVWVMNTAAPRSSRKWRKRYDLNLDEAIVPLNLTSARQALGTFTIPKYMLEQKLDRYEYDDCCALIDLPMSRLTYTKYETSRGLRGVTGYTPSLALLDM